MEQVGFPNHIDEIAENVSVSDVSQIAQKPGVQPQQPKEEGAAAQPTQEELQEAAKEMAEGMNKVAQVFNTSLAFHVDDKTGEFVVEVIDKETEEVIRQIPPKQMLKLVGNMRNVMGMLLDVEV